MYFHMKIELYEFKRHSVFGSSSKGVKRTCNIFSTHLGMSEGAHYADLIETHYF